MFLDECSGSVALLNALSKIKELHPYLVFLTDKKIGFNTNKKCEALGHHGLSQAALAILSSKAEDRGGRADTPPVPPKAGCLGTRILEDASRI